MILACHSGLDTPSKEQPRDPNSSHSQREIDPEKGAARDSKLRSEVASVAFNGPNDPDHPHNWSTLKKLSCLVTINLMIFAVSFSSSIFGTASSKLKDEFNVPNVVVHLDVALFVAGFSVGPLFFAPMSDIAGHLPPCVIGFTACGLSQIPLGLSNKFTVILICRFLAGAFGSSMVACGSGMTAEMYEPLSRAVPLAFGATMINIGSTVSPTAGSYIVARYGWRWTGWVTLILFAAIGVIMVVALRETSPTHILVARARRLRATGGEEAHKAKAPFENEAVNFRVIARKYFARPVKLICKEPILIILTVHLTFVYGTLFLTYQLFPYAFRQRGWSATTSSLPFIAVALGVISAPGIVSIFTLTWWKWRWLERGCASEPEDRLPPMILGAVIVPVALLWFGWSMNVHWISQVLAGYFIGLGLQLIFISGLVYMVEVYITCANSAVSIHIAVRSFAAASFPLWAQPMYETLGVEYAATTLAVFSALLLAFPILFFKMGLKIRNWSTFAQ